MDVVARLEAIPLSGQDLVDMSNSMGNDMVMAIDFAELAPLVRNKSGLAALNTLFSGRTRAVFVLYQILNKNGQSDRSKVAVGHWVCLLKTKRGVSYYDPYGLSISQDIHITNEPNFYIRLFQGVRVDQNRTRHQKFRDQVNTCGRHCVSRALFWFLSNNEYHQRVIRPLLRDRVVSDPDAYVSILTAFLDKSDRVLLRIGRVSTGRAARDPAGRARLKPSSLSIGVGTASLPPAPAAAAPAEEKKEEEKKEAPPTPPPSPVRRVRSPSPSEGRFKEGERPGKVGRGEAKEAETPLQTILDAVPNVTLDTAELFLRTLGDPQAVIRRLRQT